MKSTCPHCGTTYRIDPRKVPSGGVKARCSRCGGVFEIASPPADEALSGPRSAPPAPLPPHAAAAPAPSPPPAFTPPTASPPLDDSEGQVDLPELGAPAARTPDPAVPEAAPTADAAPPAPPAPPAPSAPDRPAPQAPPAAETPESPPSPPPPAPRERPTPSAPAQPPLFGRPDPHGKARRLARALISDIAVYNPERRDRGLAEGTLRQEFRDEIRKSWDEYVAQVGESIARGTPYFRDALNEILAGGRAVF